MSRRTKTTAPAIRLEGARENNLQDVTLEVAAGRLVCVTGVSGSGKSSLIDDCLAAEAQRRHDVLSGSPGAALVPYRPRVASARLPFVVSVGQGTLVWNLRSTVGTATGIWSRLRDVIPTVAEVRSVITGQPLQPPQPRVTAEWCARWRTGGRIHVLQLLAAGVQGPLREWADRAAEAAPVRSVLLAEAGNEPDLTAAHPAASLRRLTVRTPRDIYLLLAGPLSLRRDGRELAGVLAGVGHGGVVILERAAGDAQERLDLDEVLLDAGDENVYTRPSSVLLSFNSRLPGGGRCPRCDGRGFAEDIDSVQLVAQPGAPLAGGGLAIPFDAVSQRYRYFPPLAEEIRGLLIAHGMKTDASWNDLASVVRQELLCGSGDRIIQPLSDTGRPRGKRKTFTGLLERVRTALDGRGPASQVLATLRQSGPCPECGGCRLRLAGRQVHVAGRSVPEILALTFRELGPWLREAVGSLKHTRVAGTLRSLARLAETADSLGLGHLSLQRDVTSLSGGEGQRLRLVEALDAPLRATCYVFDEPTRGLHAADAGHLAVRLQELVREETIVLLAEHNPVVVAAADEVVELGPEGGPRGGRIVYQGTPARAPLLHVRTGDRSARPLPPHRLTLRGVTCRTLQDQDAAFVLGGLTCVTGVSGSGKTTLVRDVLVPTLRHYLETGERHGPGCREVRLIGPVPSGVQYVSQQALTNNPRSLVLTALGLGDMFRDAFHAGSEASGMGLTPSHFSPNTPLGQCPTCQGLGTVSPRGSQERARCPACVGSRFHPSVLWATWLGRNAGDWLETTLEGLVGIEGLPEPLREAAELCSRLGLGHLAPGRSLPTLSGGEAQRLRVAAALLESRVSGGHQVFVMDEPAAGLHPADVRRLLGAFDQIVAEGHSLLLIEHNLTVIGASDWVVDLGPGCGPEGGRVLFAGPVDEFLRADVPGSFTRTALASLSRSTSKTSGASRQQDAARRETETEDPGPADAVATFEEFLAREQGQTDDTTLRAARPTYRINAQPDGRETEDALVLLGLALPLYTLFAAESQVPGQVVYAGVQAAVADALGMLRREPKSLIGYFPLMQQLAREDVTSDELVAGLRDALRLGASGWFDGQAVQRRPPAGKKQSLDPTVVRALLDLEDDPTSTLHRAVTLGQGCCSLIDPVGRRVRDFAARAVDLKARRVGTPWLTPQVFDRALPGLACRLCDGAGRGDGLDESLILHSPTAPISDDAFFTKPALDCVRGARRSLMLPALTRLREAGLIDLTGQRCAFSAEDRAALWWGYPDKLFLKAGGDSAAPRDWHRWRGLVDYVLDGLPSATDQAWAQDVRRSRQRVPCPRCSGTGLGWEARIRQVEGVSLLAIRQRFRLADLERWLTELKCRSSEGRAAVQSLRERFAQVRGLGLEQLPCGLPVSETGARERLLARAVCAGQHGLVGAVAILGPDQGVEDFSGVVTRLGEQGVMTWTLAGEA